MRRNSILLAVIALGLASCADRAPIKVSIEIPGSAALPRDSIKALLLAGFYQEKPFQGFNVDAALVRYFLDEFKPRIKGPVEAAPIVWPGPEALTDKEFWKKTGAGRKAIILTGKATFVQETRKALLEGDSRDFDGPFKPRDPWSERKFFSLQLDLALIDARTGEPVFRKNYQETINSDNVKQTAEFAVFDMMGRIRTKLLRSLFGLERPLDRYLLVK
jgi:hypothetical protein